MSKENDELSLAEVIADEAVNDTEDKKALTRSIHIASKLIEVTITSQDPDEDLNMIKEMVIELIDKYKDTSPNYG